MLRCSFLLLALSTAPIGCGGDAMKSSDAGGNDAQPDTTHDATVQGDGAIALGWVDFTITGCSSGEGTEASPCIGASPLTLRFTALAPAEVHSQAWDFGDGSAVDLRANPEHSYARPGSYAIGLNVEGPGGTAGATRLAAVVVIPAPLTAPCAQDEDCASGDCACDASTSCTPLLADGICVLGCDSHVACGANQCVDLDPTASGVEDWQRNTCVPTCMPGAGDCLQPLTCQALRGIDGLLTYSCLPTGLLRPLGSSCVDAEGQKIDSLCASGLCLDIGLRGMCSDSCTERQCPAGTACATFVAGPLPHCLPSCETWACNGDPGLSCQADGSGFTLSDEITASEYCAPTP